MNLYVSNLGFSTQESDLRKLFEQFGKVSSAKIIMDRDTGRSRGFGFVDMESDKDANEAIKGLNNKELDGRPLSVSQAREKSSRPDRNRW